jgi:hypothetical protein
MYDISGGSMWANKSDQIISYHRPNHHTDKSSPEVTVYVQKVKRKRTGGKPGEFNIRLKWESKRFVDVVIERPFLAKNEKWYKKGDGGNSNLRLPYADDLPDDTDLPF